MAVNNGEAIIEGMITKLIEAKPLYIQVNVDTREQAQELIEWVYAKPSPFKTEMIEVCWDKEMVPVGTSDTLNKILEALSD
jgi:hypothetical protein